jgi:hypothetical protein
MSMGSTIRPLAAVLSTLLYLVAGSAEIVGINASMMPYRSGGGMFFGWLLCLAAMAITGGVLSKVMLGKGSHLVIPFFFLSLYSCLYGVLGGQLPRLISLRETGVISVTEADQPPNQSRHVFHFADGRVHPNYHWTREISRKMRAGSYHVAPIVPEGWKESDPVPVWAVGEGDGRFPSEAWTKTGVGGYRAISDATYRDMIEQRASSSRVVSKPNAPLLFLDDHPREALLAAARFELWGLLGAHVLSCAFLALPLLQRKPAAAIRSSP